MEGTENKTAEITEQDLERWITYDEDFWEELCDAIEKEEQKDGETRSTGQAG